MIIYGLFPMNAYTFHCFAYVISFNDHKKKHELDTISPHFRWRNVNTSFSTKGQTANTL